MTRRFKFVSSTTGGIDYVAIDYTRHEFSTHYYLDNGSWEPCEMVRRKDVKEELEWAKANNYTKVDRLTR